MSKSLVLWIMAFVITAMTAVYQRMTGPTHPLNATTWFEGAVVSYRLERSHGGPSGAQVSISVDEASVGGSIVWKRFKSHDDWMEIAMKREGSVLIAALPHQPPAGKILYQIRLDRGDASVLLPPEPVVLRYKGDVPLWILIPHVPGAPGTCSGA